MKTSTSTGTSSLPALLELRESTESVLATTERTLITRSLARSARSTSRLLGMADVRANFVKVNARVKGYVFNAALKAMEANPLLSAGV